ncbi:cell division control protein 48-like protein B isoform X13 [Entamoeba marina]
MITNIVSSSVKSYYRIEKTTQFDLTYSKTTVNPIVGYDGLVLQIFNALQTPKSVGVLIRGEHGSGKTTMAKYCSHQTNKKVIVHSPYQVIETPEVLLQPYTNCIIIIDNIDELLKDHSLLLLNSIRQHIQNNDVICTTTKSIPPAFTSSELLSISVNITTPTVDIRKQILSTFQTIPIDILEPLAKKTVGYLPRDLILLHNDAMAWQETTFQNDIYSAYLHAMTFITPSVMIGSETEYDKLTWNDIGGLSNVKEAMIEAVEWPMTHSEQFKKT